MIGDLVDGASLVVDIASANKDAALKELLAAAQAAGSFATKATKTLQKRMLEREAIGSTGLGNGVAVPHVKSDDVTKAALVLARSKRGLEWSAIDGRPVHIVFLLVSPAGEPETHLKCLRWIAGLARNADFRRFLMDAADANAIRELLREMEPKGSP
jgi:mannitol/fructose-specific phosphotransferase system IIA component (Ntr-type)